MTSFRTLGAAALLGAVLALMNTAARAQDLQLPFEKHVLDNGLQVVIHEDHSDPVVAVFVVYHVGSGREEVGRSGFAHLFEHLMFQGSANVGDDQHFKIVSEAGGTLNGTTNRDRTNYFETLPSNQLETALWLEADRMGFLLPAITIEKLDNQRDVVKNERRQNYENVPYRRAEAPVMAALYPAEHPYSWLTIGSHEDLTAASLEDVHAFFRRWYGPNNATLAIGGDVDPAAALALVEKYFGSIPRGPEVARPTPRPVTLASTTRLVVEDEVKLPQIDIVWPTVPHGHADEAALDLLTAVLSANKSALLDRALTVDEVLATQVTAWHQAGELAGELRVSVRSAPGVSLDTLEARVRGILAKLAVDGVDPAQLQRQKNRHEARVINQFETVSARTSALAEANVFDGDPAAATRSLKQIMAVTPEQVLAALRRYVLDRPAVIASIVPRGHLELAASGRTEGQQLAESGLDRSARPAAGPEPGFRAPAIWHESWGNGVALTGTKYTELPLVTLSLSMPGGRLRDEADTAGLASLTAELMNEGTTELDTLAFADALDELGASLSVRADDDELHVSLRTLERHLPRAAALLQDVVRRPRFDPADFERLKRQRLAALATRGDSIRSITERAWDRVQYGKDQPAGWPGAGTEQSVANLTLDDVQGFWQRHVVPTGARLVAVGDVDAAALRELLPELAGDWRGEPLPPLAEGPRPRANGTRIYLVDKPGAPQSEIRIGHAGIPSTADDWYPLSVMNYVLGGAFSSRINMNLREDKGYTYGARSGFSGGLRPGTFTASAGVRTDVTAESVAEFMKELAAIRDGVTDAERAFAADALRQAASRQYESVGALAGMLDAISALGYPDDYVAQRLARLGRLTSDDLSRMAREYVNPDAMSILVVGDAAKVREPLAALGYGEPIELDIDGNPVDGAGS